MVTMDVKERKIGQDKVYPGIDFLKFIMALLVITIHVSPLESYHSLGDILISDYLARLAVPFFFIAAGFFLFREMTPAKVMKYCIRIFKLYVICTLIYLPISIYELLTQEHAGLGELPYILINRFFWTGSYMHLWYFPALIIAVLLVYFLRKLGCSRGWLLAIGGILYVFGWMNQSYYGLWKMLPMAQNCPVFFVRNGLFFGFLFAVIGMCFATSEYRLPSWIIWTGFGITMLLGCIEVLSLSAGEWAREQDMWLFLPFCVSLLFAGGLQIQTKDPQRFIKLRRLSLTIYVVHVGFEVFYRAVILNIFPIAYNSLMDFLFTLVMSLGVALVWDKLKNGGR